MTTIENLVLIDARIDGHEGEALRDRWEFGHAMLAARDGAGRLPNGYLASLVKRTGKSQSELSYRQTFAQRCPGEEELANTLASYPSWREVALNLKRAPAPTVNSAPNGEGQVSTIVADPPWHYGNTSTRNAAANHYPSMSIEDIRALGIVPARAADRSHLYLWTTSSHLPDAFSVMEAWGFTYKTYLVWVKPQIGMGNYFRVSTELVLFGVKGGMRTNDRSLRNHFTADRSKHSAKPTSFHDLVMKASPGPYLEMFTRCHKQAVLDGQCICSKCRLGWETWGNQS